MTGAGFTATVSRLVTVPPLFVAVSTYVVVTVGETVKLGSEVTLVPLMKHRVRIPHIPRQRGRARREDGFRRGREGDNDRRSDDAVERIGVVQDHFFGHQTVVGGEPVNGADHVLAVTRVGAEPALTRGHSEAGIDRGSRARQYPVAVKTHGPAARVPNVGDVGGLRGAGNRPG